MEYVYWIKQKMGWRETMDCQTKQKAPWIIVTQSCHTLIEIILYLKLVQWFKQDCCGSCWTDGMPYLERRREEVTIPHWILVWSRPEWGEGCLSTSKWKQHPSLCPLSEVLVLSATWDQLQMKDVDSHCVIVHFVTVCFCMHKTRMKPITLFSSPALLREIC